ncbi:MAG: hypothetical protein IKK48_06230 [Firmicutes bacterium]|nr:hypothetical protein [Bacillota bacterium]
MIRNKRGEEMVEAAMVLPILILIVFTLMMVMVHFYTYHQAQMDLHKEMLCWSQENAAVFRIQKKALEYQTRLDGMVYHILQEEKQFRIYGLESADWVRLGKMAGFSDE